MTLDPGSGAGSPMSERMQSLLSRAVEDQLSEQRQVQGLVAEVRNLLAHVSSEIDALRASPPGATDELERSVASVASDVREAIRVLSERIDGVTSLVQQRGQDLAEIRAVMDTDMRPRVDALDTTLRELRGAFTGVASRVADLPGRADVEGMVTRAAVAPETDLPERLERLEETVDELHDGVLGEDGLHARIAAFANTQTDQPDVVGPVTDAVNGVVGPVTDAVNTIVQRTVEQSVARAVADSERRLSEHIDEAVLALAEALLRRRMVRPPASPFETGEIPAVRADFPPATAASPTLTEAAPPLPPPAPVAQPPGASEPAAPVHPAPHYEQPHHEPVAPVQSEPTHVDLEADREPAHVSAPFAGDELGVGDLHDDEESRKRRPWWRPGD